MSFALPDPLPPNYLTEDRGHILIVVPTIFLVLINTTFVLRQISRHILKIRFGWDDALVVVALLANVTNAIFTIRTYYHLTTHSIYKYDMLTHIL